MEGSGDDVGVLLLVSSEQLIHSCAIHVTDYGTETWGVRMTQTGKECGMNRRRRLVGLVQAIFMVVLVGLSGWAEAGLFGIGEDSWKEEVLLHDGSKMIITRSQTYGGRHEIGQPPPIKEHTVTFKLPGSSKTITWTSEYGEDIGRTNFFLLAVHVLNGTPYIVAEPYLCLSYNKWGRPNPPYVFFKYDGSAWQRIPLEAVPSEFTTMNVAISLDRGHVKEMVQLGTVTAEEIRQRNSRLSPAQYKVILREPMKPGMVGSAVSCEEMIHYKCGWISPQGTFGQEYMDKTCK